VLQLDQWRIADGFDDVFVELHLGYPPGFPRMPKAMGFRRT
jgi:hypothetical protein